MSRLSELLDSLITVLVRYNNRSPLPADTELQTLQTIRKKPHPEMIATLADIIKAATLDHQTRTPLLLYILHNIDSIMAYLELKAPIDKAISTTLSKQLGQFVIEVQELIKLSNSSTKEISYTQHGELVKVELYGFVSSNPLKWNKLSLSASILQEALFPTLGLTPSSSPTRVANNLSDMINLYRLEALEAYQDPLIKNLQTRLSTAESERESARASAKAVVEDRVVRYPSRPPAKTSIASVKESPRKPPEAVPTSIAGSFFRMIGALGGNDADNQAKHRTNRTGL